MSEPKNQTGHGREKGEEIEEVGKGRTRTEQRVCILSLDALATDTGQMFLEQTSCSRMDTHSFCASAQRTK